MRFNVVCKSRISWAVYVVVVPGSFSYKRKSLASIKNEIYTKKKDLNYEACPEIKDTSRDDREIFCGYWWKWQEEEEEDVKSYWMTLRTGEDTLIWKRKL
jgi:hypothetical protein